MKNKAGNSKKVLIKLNFVSTEFWCFFVLVVKWNDSLKFYTICVKIDILNAKFVSLSEFCLPQLLRGCSNSSFRQYRSWKRGWRAFQLLFTTSSLVLTQKEIFIDCVILWLVYLHTWEYLLEQQVTRHRNMGIAQACASFFRQTKFETFAAPILVVCIEWSSFIKENYCSREAFTAYLNWWQSIFFIAIINADIEQHTRQIVPVAKYSSEFVSD